MSVSSVYAKALIQAATPNELEVLELELFSAAQMISDSNLRIALGSPITTREEKELVVTEVSKKAKLSPLLSRFLLLLTKRGRVSELSQIAQEFKRMRLEALGGVVGSVVSADPMERLEIESLAEAFSKKLGKKVHLESSVDTSLLAGLRVTVSGITYDGSLRAQLERLRSVLVQSS